MVVQVAVSSTCRSTTVPCTREALWIRDAVSRRTRPMPVALPDPGWWCDTVAVKVTLWPETVVPFPETAVEVEAALTCSCAGHNPSIGRLHGLRTSGRRGTGAGRATSVSIGDRKSR